MTIEARIASVRKPLVVVGARTGPPAPPSLLARLQVLWRAYLAHNDRAWARTAEVQARSPSIA